MNITWMFKMAAGGGPTITAANSLDLETYVRTSVTVNSGSPVAVGFVASPSLLAVIASKYEEAGTPGTFVTYQINGAGTHKNLDGPLVFIGAENVKLIDTNLASLTFTNPFAQPIDIEVFSSTDI